MYANKFDFSQTIAQHERPAFFIWHALSFYKNRKNVFKNTSSWDVCTKTSMEEKN